MLFNCLAHRWRQPIREYAGEEVPVAVLTNGKEG
jgi:hypothetical protein